MFGKHYESAEATVLYAEISDHASSGRHHSEFILDVRPVNRPIFRAAIKETFVAASLRPKVGDVLKVKYDPKSLKVEFDLKGDRRYDLHAHEQAREEEIRMQRQALLSSAPGTPPPATPFNQSSMPGTLAALSRLENISIQGHVVDLPQDQKAQLASIIQSAFAQQTTTSHNPQPQTQAALLQYVTMAQELTTHGESGTATIMRLQPTGVTYPPFTVYEATVQVMPSNGFPFEANFTAWVNTSKHTVYEGTTVPVKYDPDNHARMVFSFSA